MTQIERHLNPFGDVLWRLTPESRDKVKALLRELAAEMARTTAETDKRPEYRRLCIVNVSTWCEVVSVSDLQKRHPPILDEFRHFDIRYGEGAWDELRQEVLEHDPSQDTVVLWDGEMSDQAGTFSLDRVSLDRPKAPDIVQPESGRAIRIRD
jgi:hypothetical protein